MERKNPRGLVKAFQLAFEKRDDVMLLIKTINVKYTPEKASWLHKVAEGYPNIHFINEHISREAMMSLIASLDSYASLHRSEGFGIGMAQAMYLGKPVIATGYSGNLEFMNSENSFLVRHKLVELKENYHPYEKGNVWAEPDLEHAAELMRLVFENRTLSNQIARRAESDIKTKMSPEAAGKEIKERLLTIS
jgi:glycosyltransferase involved in cell wall biosynthesis